MELFLPDEFLNSDFAVLDHCLVEFDQVRFSFRDWITYIVVCLGSLLDCVDSVFVAQVRVGLLHWGCGFDQLR